MEEIIKRIQNGEKELLNDILKDNIEYIYSYTYKYYGIFNDYEDLVQVAMLAFVKAVYSYKFNGYFLTSHANLWITKNIERYILRNLDNINDIEEKYKICINIYEKCITYYKHEPNAIEVSRYTNSNETIGSTILNVVNNYDVENKKYEDELYIDDTEAESLKRLESDLFIKKYIDGTLTDNQKKVIMYKYGFYDRCYRESEISEKLGVSRQCVSNCHEYAIKKLKKKYKEKTFKHY